MNETIKTIHQRQSCRNYQAVKIPLDILSCILDAGLQAPSSMNRQQCLITAVTNQTILKQLTKEVTVALNKEDSYSCFYNANTVIIVSGPKEYNALFTDGSCILQNIFLAATCYQLGSCWVNQLHGLEDTPAIRKLLTACKIPNDHHICGCAILGYANEEIVKKEKYSHRIQCIE